MRISIGISMLTICLGGCLVPSDDPRFRPPSGDDDCSVLPVPFETFEYAISGAGVGVVDGIYSVRYENAGTQRWYFEQEQGAATIGFESDRGWTLNSNDPGAGIPTILYVANGSAGLPPAGAVWTTVDGVDPPPTGSLMNAVRLRPYFTCF